MANAKKTDPSLRPNDEPSELLKDLLIIHLLQAGVKYREVQKLARCSGNRISRISKALRNGSSGS